MPADLVFAFCRWWSISWGAGGAPPFPSPRSMRTYRWPCSSAVSPPTSLASSCEWPCAYTALHSYSEWSSTALKPSVALHLHSEWPGTYTVSGLALVQ